jgi:AcrR family transcriptional regulator
MTKKKPTRETEPRARDAERSQKDILDAAQDEFASYGLGGARMDRIAERAGLNKRLIYYYFESKEGLFLAVLERAYERIRTEERALNLSKEEPTEAILPASLPAFVPPVVEPPKADIVITIE